MKYLLIYAFSLAGAFLAAQPVIWQHGLGSGQKFWAETAAQFATERSASISRTTNFNVNTTRGVRAMAQDIVII